MRFFGSLVLRAVSVVVVVAASGGSVAANPWQNTAAGRVPGSVAIVGGLFTMPLAASGLRDVDVSDWETCGLGDGGSCPEGRVSLPLSAGNSEGQRFGLRIGAEYALTADLWVDVRAALTVGTMTGGLFAIGATWVPLQFGDLQVGFGGKIGFVYAQMDFGQAQQIPGYTQPVITPMGTFFDGDPLRASLSGFLAGAGATLSYPLMDRISLRIDAGLQYAATGDLDIRGGDIDIDGDAAAVVLPGGGNTRAGKRGEGDAIGPYAMLGVAYQL